MFDRLVSLFSKITTKQLFLIDGIGAMVSASFLGIVLVQFEHLIGMPKDILYYLALVPCFFAIYSLACYFFLRENRRQFLRIIAIGNLLYCLLTAILVYYFFADLSTLGVFYFINEILLILILVGIELQRAFSNADGGRSSP